jgi:tetratricopeptide (TPR) repeat protein/predicted Ser/Thr protein kinase
MPALSSCPLGHQWEDLFDDQMSLVDGQTRCPVCGIALDSIPAELATQAALLPPTRRIPASTKSPSDMSSVDIGAAGQSSTRTSPAPAPPAPDRAPIRGAKDIPTVAGSEEPSQSGVAGPSFQGYEILGELGRGGMGVVYKARQIGLKRLVALKVVLGGNYAGEVQRRRFQLEAHAVARLHHPNIVQIYDVGEQDGHPYFTLEYVDGGSLSDKFGGRGMPPREAAQLIAVLARAIHYAHERGIVHRDLKPGNVLLAGDGTPKITDFGLAKLMDAEDHTRTGSVLGTPSYMAPEQAMGHNKTIGPAADIYALGSILYEAVTGRPPFRGETSMDLLIRLAKEDPEPLSHIRPGVPRDLETVCLKCLQKEPRKRYPTALALAEDLRLFLAHEPVRARPANLWERGVKWVKRRPTTAAVLAFLTIAAVAFSAQAGIQAASRARDERQRQESARAEIRDTLVRAQEAVKSKAWDAGEELFASAESKIENNPDLVSLPDEAGDLIPFIRGRLAAHKTLQQFFQKRDEALFHATLSTGEGSGNDLRAARDKAREALGLVGVTLAANTEWSLGDSFTAQEKNEVREKCYELLLVLADAEAQPLPGQATEEQRRRAAEALLILDRAPLLGLQTKAYHLRRARFLELCGRQEAAAQDIARADQQPAQSALDHYLLGDELYRQGSPDKAEKEFQQTIRAEPGHFWAEYFQALCYVRMFKPDLARDSLNSCVSKHADIVWIYLMRGFALGQLKDYEDAEADFDKALTLLEKQPNSEAAYVLYNNRAIMRVGQKKFEGAIADLRQAIVLRPRQYQAYASLAQTLHLLKQPGEAVGQLDEAIKAAEPLVASQVVEPATLALLYRTRARFQREREDIAAALADMERAAALAPAGSVMLAQAQVERGQLLSLSGRADEALAAYDSAVKARPVHALGHRGRGEALFRLKRYADAVQAFSDYFKFEPQPAMEVYQARGLAHIRLGEPNEALSDFTLAVHLAPNNATLLTQRGQAFLACQNDKHEAALADFEKAIACDPKNAGPAYSGRARIRLDLGQISLAVADIDKSLQLGRRTPGVVYTAATLYARAAGKLDADRERKDRAELEKRGLYQDQALALLGETLRLLPEEKRAAFWRDTVQRDSSLAAIRHSIEFARLRRQYSSGDGAPNTPPPPSGSGISSGARPPK